jgi:hypothetical protein
MWTRDVGLVSGTNTQQSRTKASTRVGDTFDWLPFPFAWTAGAEAALVMVA